MTDKHNTFGASSSLSAADALLRSYQIDRRGKHRQITEENIRSRDEVVTRWVEDDRRFTLLFRQAGIQVQGFEVKDWKPIATLLNQRSNTITKYWGRHWDRRRIKSYKKQKNRDSDVRAAMDAFLGEIVIPTELYAAGRLLLLLDYFQRHVMQNRPELPLTLETAHCLRCCLVSPAWNQSIQEDSRQQLQNVAEQIIDQACSVPGVDTRLIPTVPALIEAYFQTWFDSLCLLQAFRETMIG